LQKRVKLSFSDIHPFIRYARILDVSRGEYTILTAAYDYRLFYVSRGYGKMYLENSVFGLNKGDLLFWQPGIPYRMDTDGDKSLQFIALNFDLTQTNKHRDYPFPPVKFTAFQPEEILELIDFTDFPRLNEPVYIQGMQQIEETLQEIVLEERTKKAFFRERMSGMAISVLASIARALALGQVERRNTGKIDKVIEYIHSNYAENITNASIGKLFNYHPNYLNKLMMLYTEKPLHQYLIAHRLSMAINLIIESNLPLAEIARMTGFNDYCHFSKLFKKRTGSSPNAFRQTTR
jgi:AraC-like DNA-binding protein